MNELRTALELIADAISATHMLVTDPRYCSTYPSRPSAAPMMASQIAPTM